MAERKTILGPRTRIQLIIDGEPVFSKPIYSAAELWDAMKAEVATWDRELFIIVLLTNDNMVIGVDEVSVSGSAIDVVSPYDVIKSVILSNAAAFIFIHNHPEDNSEPNENDRRVTAQIMELSKILDVPLLDYIIFGRKGYYSVIERSELGNKKKTVRGH